MKPAKHCVTQLLCTRLRCYTVLISTYGKRLFSYDRYMMPLLTTPDTNLYYEIFQPAFTTNRLISYSTETVLLLHGLAGTPETDFEAQLPHLRRRFRVLAPHLH